jgi:hypothetical protein
MPYRLQFCISTRGGVAIGNGNSAKRLSSFFYRIFWPAHSVTVAPPIDSNTLNIPVEIKQFLHRAAYHGHKEIVELLIAKGADVNAKDDDGKTPLNWAIDFKKTETADLLRKHGGKTGEELKAEGK